MIGVTVDVHSLVMGSPSGPIHIVDLPVHSPASLARSSCILPGVPARMQACMSSAVQPAGSFRSFNLSASDSFSLATATVSEPTIAAMPAAASMGRMSFFKLMGTSEKSKKGLGTLGRTLVAMIRLRPSLSNRGLWLGKELSFEMGTLTVAEQKDAPAIRV